MSVRLIEVPTTVLRKTQDEHLMSFEEKIGRRVECVENSFWGMGDWRS